jgi:ATP-dependent DNA ligase
LFISGINRLIIESGISPESQQRSDVRTARAFMARVAARIHAQLFPVPSGVSLFSKSPRAPHLPSLYRRGASDGSRPFAMSAGFIAPFLSTSAQQPPSGELWLHEIKHDGFRVIARKEGKRVTLYSRAHTMT